MSSGVTKKPALHLDRAKGLPDQTWEYLSSIKTILDQYEGVLGSTNDQIVTKEDLERIGIDLISLETQTPSYFFDEITWNGENANRTVPVSSILVARATDCTVAKFTDYIVPSTMDGMYLKEIIMTCTTAGTTSTMIGMVEKNGTDMLSTGVSIDTTPEVTSTTAATAYVVKTDGTQYIATGDVLTFELTQVHSGTAAKGAVMSLVFGWD